MTTENRYACIDDTWNRGRDPWEQEAAYEELLQVAEKYPCGEWNQVIARKLKRPVLFTFSHLRENLVNWLPIGPKDRILEIGSGCGEITGALSRAAKEVVCVERSLKKSRINALRNGASGNVHIFVGIWQDLLMRIPGSFDYVFLAGSFADAGALMHGEDPHEELLKSLAGFLNPHGRIVIAIENRLGLKYWAGCREEHTDRYFAGLEGFDGAGNRRTFSRRELSELIGRAGRFKTEFYYPCPDHVFPTEIFSDRYLPKPGELKGSYRNFDRERMLLFDEQKVMDSLIGSGLFGEFANSFLVVLEKEGAE
ncbi:MAG: class I SAM-dependent methyltransferase [Blautia sp.]|nr:class I SAM-dependent methyltransferase [Blautia sp.]